MVLNSYLALKVRVDAGDVDKEEVDGEDEEEEVEEGKKVNFNFSSTSGSISTKFEPTKMHIKVFHSSKIT